MRSILDMVLRSCLSYSSSAVIWEFVSFEFELPEKTSAIFANMDEEEWTTDYPSCCRTMQDAKRRTKLSALESVSKVKPSRRGENQRRESSEDGRKCVCGRQVLSTGEAEMRRP